MFAPQPQAGATGDEGLDAGADPQQLGQQRAGTDQAFEAIEQEHHRPIGELRLQMVEQRRVVRLRQVERRRDRRQQPVRIAERGEPDQVDVSGKKAFERPCRVNRQSRFADPTWTGQRDQTCAVEVEQIDQGVEVAFAPNEWLEGKGQA